MAYLVGLTGGIGSGKSTVSRLLSLLKYPCYDSDSRASWLMENDRSIIYQLRDLLGEESYCFDGSLNRRYISDLIFQDDQLLSKVNNIVHPAVMRDMQAWSCMQTGEYLFVESAILLNSFLLEQVDSVVLVISDRLLRIERVLNRSDLTIEQIEARMSAQMSDKEMIAYSDYIIYNNNNCSLIEQVYRMNDYFTQNRDIER